LTKISIFGRDFDFLVKFRFWPIQFFYRNFDILRTISIKISKGFRFPHFWPNFVISYQLYFAQKFSFLPKFFIFFTKIFHFFTKFFHFLPKFFIFCQNFSFFTKTFHFFTKIFDFWPEVFIFDQKFSFLTRSFHFWPEVFIFDQNQISLL